MISGWRFLTPEQRFFRRCVFQPNGCITYDSHLVNGYGRLSVNGVTVLAHRFAWELFNGPIPNDLFVDHLCRNRACANPAHMELTDRGTNVLRSPIAIPAVNLRKTHCIHGHSFADAYRYQDKKGRWYRLCRTCQIARSRRQQSRLRSAKAQGVIDA